MGRLLGCSVISVLSSEDEAGVATWYAMWSFSSSGRLFQPCESDRGCSIVVLELLEMIIIWKLSNGIERSFVLERGASAVESVKQDPDMIPAVRP